MKKQIAKNVCKRPAKPVDDPKAGYKGFSRSSTTIKKGTCCQKGAMPLPCDIIADKNVALKMRDGVTIYADVFRPVTNEKIPAIVNYSPYGKGGTGAFELNEFPNRFGVPKSALSGLQAWEGNDPAYWCNHGYAIVQVDARGAFDSEGDIIYFGSGEGHDGHDAIEEIAKLSWCSGKIGMSGNSWLAMAQWRIAAECPPHLAAIAPWEGMTDPYKDIFARGGIPNVGFPEYVINLLYGRNKVEDPMAMLGERPLYDDYWADKFPDISRINIPAYVVASYTNPVHVIGTFRGYRMLKGNKWLRIHNTVEWPDFYDPKYSEDLRRFFDRYLLGKNNGWDNAQPVRMSILDPGHQDIVDQPEQAFPPIGVRGEELYLNASTGRLESSLSHKEAVAEYNLNSKQPYVDFIYIFERDTDIIGFPSLTVWVAVDGNNDGDLYVQIQKLDKKGRQLFHQTSDIGMPISRKLLPLIFKAGVKRAELLFFGGTDGMLRLSRRGIAQVSQDNYTELALDAESKIFDKQIVEAQIPLQPIAMRWHKGEQLRLRISSNPLKPPALPGLPRPATLGGDKHLIHTGGKYASKLQISYSRGENP